ncbi:acyl-ACP--UDP-N-acetylglucosamine O-acyltransferase [Chlorobium phaeovibrioides]|uniref:Acyl-[acyl-carrier-protein]--UDP-N-acetylglucosamine O-acyltransferase n=1 Tax=Chlorobium phaeovibrioides TaxID=1094 RepID=A0A432AV75_CHLPH|nr:acyl-ACP--UDP-N-acetylglucosamine O-acyltransferase [Chlorobium phaeovibrioides]KAA6231936.1 acyl-ACP--UDP-N-acetylglucosamine O-acyltransferase [Chlorobium phaeovibrioides]MWV53558.1 acyl-ACP--UDP-N-acetylglucosamine O-acyltransferase [Chlorobium phaeovibrioides]QEQ57509.1 acyl-ACP--UDP-N-acetylglucosamine O-acyltransferase [Chlorobium phaeovibrioides]RTY37845.1 acyl-ACP--UDP-N-acetylglucosamine O-acyltransferase [Chlorobium phaeovibrioides]
MQNSIHAGAVIDRGAQLAQGVSVGPFTVIEDDVRIGEGTVIGPHVHIASGARIGSGCRIHAGAVLATEPQDLKFNGEKTELFVGDRTVIRECVTLNRGTVASGKTVVGSDCLIMAYVHAGHDCVIGNNVVIANSVQFGGHCEVGDYVVVGGLAGVHQFVRIGRYAMVGGISRAALDVPPFVMAGGHASFRYEGLNAIGLKRRGFSPESITLIKDAYRVLFQSGLLLGNALEKVRAEFPKEPEILEILDFFDSGKHGRKFIRPFNS